MALKHMSSRLGQILDLIDYCNISHYTQYFSEYRTAVTASLGFYFEKKKHVELLSQWRQCTSTFGRLLHVNSPEVEACIYKHMEDLVTKKNASSPVCQYFRLKQKKLRAKRFE